MKIYVLKCIQDGDMFGVEYFSSFEKALKRGKEHGIIGKDETIVKYSSFNDETHECTEKDVPATISYFSKYTSMMYFESGTTIELEMVQ